MHVNKTIQLFVFMTLVENISLQFKNIDKTLIIFLAFIN